MTEGFDRLKAKNWFKLSRDLVNYAIETLNDAEFKLWVALKGSAYDFDGENLGKVSITLGLIEKYFAWSRGKSSQTLSGLLHKGFVKRIKKGHYYVSQNLEEVQNNEHQSVQVSEHKVQSDEVNVLSNEQNSFNPLSFKDKESSNPLSSQQYVNSTSADLTDSDFDEIDEDDIENTSVPSLEHRTLGQMDTDEQIELVESIFRRDSEGVQESSEEVSGVD